MTDRQLVWYKDVHDMESFDWDEGNKLKNWLKHKISIKESESVFFDKSSAQFKDLKHSGNEKRFIIIGKSIKNKILHIAFTVRVRKIRIISARKANKKETNYYENNKK